MFHRFHACVSIDTTSFSDEDDSKEKYTEYRNSRPQEIVRPRVSNFRRENFHRARVSAGALPRSRADHGLGASVLCLRAQKLALLRLRTFRSNMFFMIRQQFQAGKLVHMNTFEF